MSMFADIWALLLLPVALGLGLLFARGARRAGRLRALFSDPAMHPALGLGLDRKRAAAYAALVVAAFAVAALSAARPQGGMTEEESQKAGMDVIVVLDVSLSMAADDMEGGRLAYAKRSLTELVAKTPGNRYGLVSFAGEPTVVCPLTHDHEAFLTMLADEGMSPYSLGGSAVGDAVVTALTRFKKEESPRAILVVTDGENTYGTDPAEAAGAVKEAGLKAHVLGVGTSEGARIVIGRDFFGTPSYKVDRSGNTVVSRMDEDMLKSMAESGGGGYFDASDSGAVDGLRGALAERSDKPVMVKSKNVNEYGPTLSLVAAAVLLVAVLL